VLVSPQVYCGHFLSNGNLSSRKILSTLPSLSKRWKDSVFTKTIPGRPWNMWSITLEFALVWIYPQSRVYQKVCRFSPCRVQSKRRTQREVAVYCQVQPHRCCIVENISIRISEMLCPSVDVFVFLGDDYCILFLDNCRITGRFACRRLHDFVRCSCVASLSVTIVL